LYVCAHKTKRFIVAIKYAEEETADPAKFEAESATNETHKLVALDAP
jgi:hypothetical protein